MQWKIGDGKDGKPLQIRKNNDMGDVVRQKYKLYLTNKKDKGRIKNDDKYVVCPAVCGLRLPADDDFMLKKERVVLC